MGPQVRRHLALAARRGTSCVWEVVTTGMGGRMLHVFTEPVGIVAALRTAGTGAERAIPCRGQAGQAPSGPHSGPQVCALPPAAQSHHRLG